MPLSTNRFTSLGLFSFLNFIDSFSGSLELKSLSASISDYLIIDSSDSHVFRSLWFHSSFLLRSEDAERVPWLLFCKALSDARAGVDSSSESDFHDVHGRGVTTSCSIFSIANRDWQVVYKNSFWSPCPKCRFCSILFILRFTSSVSKVINAWHRATLPIKCVHTPTDCARDLVFIIGSFSIFLFWIKSTVTSPPTLNEGVFTPSLVASYQTCSAL